MDQENDITVILADDHELLRSGFMSDFQKLGINVLAVAKDGEELVQLVRQHRPRVVITDIRMPVMDGFEATATIKKEFPETRVLAFSAFDELALILGMKEAGADGFALKITANEELRNGIRMLNSGQEFYCTQTAKTLLASHFKSGPLPLPDIHLTPREEQVLKLVAKGYFNKEIAAELGIRRRTVEAHRNALHKKTGTSNSVELAIFYEKWLAQKHTSLNRDDTD